MLRQFLLGTAVSVCNIAIHAMVMVAVIQVARITVRVQRRVNLFD